MRIYKGRRARATSSITSTPQAREDPRIVRMHAADMTTSKSPPPATSWRSSAWSAPRETLSRRHRRLHHDSCTSRGGHVARRLAEEPGSSSELLESAHRFSRRSDLPAFTATTSPTRHHLRHGRVASGNLHRTHEARRQCEVNVGKPQSLYRETITKKSDSITHKKQRAARAQYAKISGYMEPIPSDAGLTYDSSTKPWAAPFPRKYVPGCEKGSKSSSEGPAQRLPVVNVRFVLQDGNYLPGRLLGARVPHRLMAGFREAYSGRRTQILEPIMKVEVSAPEEFQGPCRSAEPTPRRHPRFLDRKYFVARVGCRSEMFGYSTRAFGDQQASSRWNFREVRPCPRNVKKISGVPSEEERGTSNARPRVFLRVKLISSRHDARVRGSALVPRHRFRKIF